MFWIDLRMKNPETIWISPPMRLRILIQSEDAWKWDWWLRVVSTFSFWSPSLGPTSTIFTNFGYSCPVAVWRTYKGVGAVGEGHKENREEWWSTGHGTQGVCHAFGMGRSRTCCFWHGHLSTSKPGWNQRGKACICYCVRMQYQVMCHKATNQSEGKGEHVTNTVGLYLAWSLYRGLEIAKIIWFDEQFTK